MGISMITIARSVMVILPIFITKSCHLHIAYSSTTNRLQRFNNSTL